MKTTTKAAPISYSQRKYWRFNEKNPGNPTFNLISSYRIAGPLDTRVLEKSFNEIVRRHETLRTMFREVNGQPTQVICSHLELPVPVIDLSQIPGSEQEKEIEQLIEKEAHFSYDFANGPLIRLTVLRLAKEEHVLIRGMQHICSDAWSLGIFRKELGPLYEAFSRGTTSPLPPLALPYSSYVYWQQNWLQSREARSHLAFWKQELAGPLPQLNLPGQSPRPPVQTYKAARQTITLTKQLYDSLTTLCAQTQATLFIIMLASFNVLLHLYSGQTDMIVGTPVSGRTRAELEKSIGCFADFIALRTDLKGNPTFTALLDRMKQAVMEAFAHHLPFEKLLEELKPGNGTNHPPVFRVILNMLNDEDFQLDLQDLQVQRIVFYKKRTEVDLKVLLMRKKDGLSILVYYDTDLFSSSSVTKFLTDYRDLLEKIVSNPGQRISAIK